MIPIFKTDSYKLFHREQYPDRTTRIYSTLTARSFKFFNEAFDFKKIDDVPLNGDKVVYGVGRALIRVDQDGYDNFVCETGEIIETQVKEFDKKTANAYQMVKILPQLKQLHKTLRKIKTKENQQTREFLKTSISKVLDIRYLSDYIPIKENTVILEIINKEEYPEFFGLVNYLEVQILEEIGAEMTCANISKAYYNLGMTYAYKTSDHPDFVEYQFHDFSQRGISSSESALRTGAGHLAYLRGTDNLQAALEGKPISKYDTQLPPKSIPATEHSVMCINKYEEETFARLLKLYPTGNLSVVADGFDFYRFTSSILLQFKDLILEREGKIIIRPDSGDPGNILFGTQIATDFELSYGDARFHGLLGCLDQIFGHTKNSQGYKVLDSHIGIIYGDGIDFNLAGRILEYMEKLGGSSENITFGIGAFTYQYITRDTLGFAFKSSSYLIDGKGSYISKDPITAPDKKAGKGFTRYDAITKTTVNNLTYNEGNAKTGILDDLKGGDFNEN